MYKNSINLIRPFFSKFLHNFRFIEFKYSILISLIIKVIIFLIFLNIDLSKLPGDQSKYWGMTEKIITENGFFSIDFGAMRVPIYVIFLSILKNIYNNLYFVISVQLIISFFTLFIIFEIGKLFSLNIAKISIILASINIGLLNSSFFILTESIFLLFFLLFIFFLLKAETKSDNDQIKYIILSSIFLGISTLTRPIGFYFFLIIFLIYFKSHILKNIKKTIIFLITFSIVLSPWCIRNQNVFGYYKLTNSIGPNLAGYYYPYLKSINDNISTKEARFIIYDDLKKSINYDQNPFIFSNLEKNFFFEKTKNYEIDIFFKAWLKGNMKFLLTPSIVDTFYLLDISKTNYSQINEKDFFKKIRLYIFENDNYIFSLLLIFFIILILIFRFLAFYSLFLFDKKNYFKICVFLAVIIINLILTGPIGSARYRIIVEPFLIILTSISLEFIFKKYFKKIILRR